MEVCLRPLHIDDALISWKWRNDPDVWKFTGKRPDKPITEDIELKWIKEVLERKNEKRFAICIKETDQYIGNVQLTSINGYDAEFHIFIGEKSFWGKGIAQQATAIITKHAFNELKLQSVYLDVKTENIAAIKAYEKAGYREIFQYDEYIRMAVYATDAVEKKVSVFMMTYNHKKYLIDALESILKQKTSFSYEVVVGDDCSNDGTRELLLEYAIKYRNIFKLIFYPQKVGAALNQQWVMKKCSSEYVAVCEGDDYWTNDNKLQIQVDFLSKNSAFVMCCHRSYLVKGKKRTESSPIVGSNILNLASLAEKNCIYTASVVFRNIFNGNLPLWVAESPAGDYVIWMLLAQHGDIYIMSDVMSAYRINSGVWTSQNTENAYGKWVKVLKLLESYFKNNEKVLSVLYNQHIDTRLLLHNYFTKHNLLEKANNEITLLKKEIPLDFHYLLINNLAKRYQDLLNSKRYRLGTYLSKFNLIRG